MPDTDLAVRDDIAADVRNAMAEGLKTDAPPPEPIVETIAEPGPETEEKPARDDNRDELGRFKAKEQEAAVASVPQPAQRQQPAESVAPKGLIPPANWEPEAKAAFMAAPPAIQKQILARAEQDEKGRAEWEPKAQTYTQMEQVIAPHRARWQAQGVSDAQAIAYLAQAQAQLEQDPIAGLAQIARSYGVTPQQLLSRLGGGQQHEGEPSQAFNDPRVDQLAGVVQQLYGQLTQREQQERQQAMAAIEEEIAAFRADPKNLYFDNVQPTMQALFRTGQAKTLAEAYEKATWSDPTIRKLIMAADSAKASEDKARADAAARAKRAGVQTTGDPGAGVAARSTSNNPTEDVRGDVIRAIREARSQA